MRDVKTGEPLDPKRLEGVVFREHQPLDLVEEDGDDLADWIDRPGLRGDDPIDFKAMGVGWLLDLARGESIMAAFLPEPWPDCGFLMPTPAGHYALCHAPIEDEL